MTGEGQNYDHAVRLAPHGCLLVASGAITDANGEAAAVVGQPVERLRGTPLAELLLPEFEDVCLGLLSAPPGASTTTAAVRLHRALAPVELSVRVVEPHVALVGVRSMDVEQHYSALARADLTHDSTTGFPNRYYLVTLMRDRLASPTGKRLALIGLWVDDLASVGGAGGELVGHRVVQEVAERVAARLRTPDVVGRLDEAGFLGLLTSNATVGQLTTIAERLRAEVAFPVEIESGLVSFTASVAVGSLPATGDDPEAAERALRQLRLAADEASTGPGNQTTILEL